MIRIATVEDAADIAKIYNYYVENTTVTFEEVAVTDEEMIRRIKNINQEYHWVVAEEEGKIIGYAYAGKWRERSAYRFSVEATVYMNREYKGKGIAKELYTELFKRLREDGRKLAIVGISMTNKESIIFHEKMGFEKVAEFKNVGFKMNQWLNVGYWQCEV